MQKANYIYLLREREFLNNKKPIYKIGKTTCADPNVRLRQYPKGGELIMVTEVDDCHTTERQLLDRFDNNYIQRRDIGREYYEGDRNHMKRTIMHVVDKEYLQPYVESKKTGFGWSILKAISRLFAWN